MRALLLIFPGAGSGGVPRHFVDAGRYFAGSVGLSVAALFLGLYLVRALT
ncbi:hypothetical+protein [Methylocapsa aurea]